jgi:hypothetical protein
VTLRKVDVIVGGAAFLVVIGIAMLPSPRDRNPKIPVNADHQAVAVEKICQNCHTPTGIRPLPERHPKRQDCFRCHARTGG